MNETPETRVTLAPYTVWAFVPEKRTPLTSKFVSFVSEWIDPEHFEYVSDCSNLPSAKRLVSMYPDYRIFDNQLGVWLK